LGEIVNLLYDSQGGYEFPRGSSMLTRLAPLTMNDIFSKGLVKRLDLTKLWKLRGLVEQYRITYPSGKNRVLVMLLLELNDIMRDTD